MTKFTLKQNTVPGYLEHIVYVNILTYKLKLLIIVLLLENKKLLTKAEELEEEG